MTDELSSFPTHTIHPDRVLYRIHRTRNEPLYFCSSGVSRFDLVGAGDRGTCYVAMSALGAFIETFGRFRFLTSETVAERSLSSLSLTRAITLADITDRSVLGGFGITGDISAGTDYEQPQSWATKLDEAGFEGILYAARHDPAFTERSVALFGDQDSGSKLFEVVTEPISDDLVAEASDEFGFTVWPSAPLA